MSGGPMRLRVYSFAEISYFARACYWLRRARTHYRHSTGGDLVEMVSNLEVTPAMPATIDLQLVGWSLASAGRFVTGGSNCLLQAIAAAEWLASEGVASQLKLGVKPGDGDGLAAHARLAANDKIVVGGKISHEYAELKPAGSKAR